LGKDEARDAIVRMGNQALQGADFTTVAKTGNSDSDGAVCDWPDKSARIPQEVEKAIAGLPAGQMSPILEDWWGYYIVRVVERLAAYHQPFDEVQSDIREKIKQQRTNEQMQTYLTRLREQTPVWTVLDDKPAASRAADRRTSPARPN
jgi:parvulin-like peptidyl-prolyl isomerase